MRSGREELGQGERVVGDVRGGEARLGCERSEVRVRGVRSA